jgi:hypothetical protein
VADQGVLDLDLLRDREGTADGSRIYQHAVIDEEGRGPLPQTLAAVGPEDFNLQ